MLRQTARLTVLTAAVLAGMWCAAGVAAAANVGTTLSLSTSADPSALGQTVRVVAVVRSQMHGIGTPTGTVQFTTGGSASTGAGAIPGCASMPLVDGRATCSVTYDTAGSQSITASYTGDSEFAGSADSLVQAVNQGATTTSLSSSDNPSSPGEQVTYTAAVKGPKGVGAPTGTVAFTTTGSAGTGAGVISGCESVPLAGGVATCMITYSATGSQGIEASYGGDANFAASSSPSLTQTVAAAATTLQLTSSADPSALGKRVTYTAAVTASSGGTPQGTVSFATSGSASTGAGPIPGCASVRLSAGGQAKCTVTYTSAGSPQISAAYTGVGGFAGSSGSLIQTVNQGATTTTLSTSDDPSSPGEQVSYTAAVNAKAAGAGTPTGTVEFSTSGSATTGAGAISGCESVPLVDGIATCTVTYSATGSQKITASYSGDRNFLASGSPSLTQTVAAAPTTLQLSSSADPSAVGGQVTYTAVVSNTGSGGGTPTGTVSFATGGSASTGAGPIPGCTDVPLAGGTATCTVTYTSASSQQISATYEGVGGFTGSSDSLIQTVS